MSPRFRYPFTYIIDHMIRPNTLINYEYTVVVEKCALSEPYSPYRLGVYVMVH